MSPKCDLLARDVDARRARRDAIIMSGWVPASLHPITGRPASPRNLPSVLGPVANNSILRKRGSYQGGSDAMHLGGFTDLDVDGLSPRVWRYMMQNLTVKSVIDVGCGKGISTSWFKAHGARVQCVEGSSEAVKNSRLPPELVVEHDFSQGSWWPNRTFDAAWSVEFTEHVGRQYMHNYLPIFDSAALIFVSHSHWGGWHHVEVHDNDWWITVRVCWRSNSRHGPPF